MVFYYYLHYYLEWCKGQGLFFRKKKKKQEHLTLRNRKTWIASLLLLSFTWICFVWILLPDNNYCSQLKGLNFRRKHNGIGHWNWKNLNSLLSILSAPFKLYFNLFCLGSFSWQLLRALRKDLSLCEMVHMCTSLCPFNCSWKKKHTHMFHYKLIPWGKILWTKINSLHFSLLKNFSLHMNLPIFMLYLF